MSFKKIVAREGLIFLAFLVWGVACFFAMINFPAFGDAGEKLVPVFFTAGAYSYPAFLVLRFVFWAIKTLNSR